jgi:hypothetical protein
MDEGMLNGKAAMARFCNLISSEPDIAKVIYYYSMRYICSVNFVFVLNFSIYASQCS